jgi:limonene 1,2-monooxygenase
MSVYRPARLKFGIFLAPFHRHGENPTVAIDRDIELIEHLDRLDFDEVWIGEHHSAGWEIISSPELIIAAAARTTRTIRLGTGVSSLPYHHPLILADRMVQLDHMTRGRAMFGVGPGALTSDAHMLGIEAETQRERMAEGLDVILRLFRGETVTCRTGWFTLQDARLQLAPYSRPHMEVAVAAALSPAGPLTSGRFGVGMLSIGTSLPGGLVDLKAVWAMHEDAARQAGATVSRDNWKLVMPVHLAESRGEAFANVQEGFRAHYEDYFHGTVGRPYEGPVEAMVERGAAIVGAPDDAIQAIENLLELSGGFGGLLASANDWTTWEKTKHSYELWARYVAPRFQGSVERPIASREWVRANRTTIFAPQNRAIVKAFEDAGVPMPEAVARRARLGHDSTGDSAP